MYALVPVSDVCREGSRGERFGSDGGDGSGMAHDGFASGRKGGNSWSNIEVLVGEVVGALISWTPISKGFD